MTWYGMPHDDLEPGGYLCSLEGAMTVPDEDWSQHVYRWMTETLVY